MVGYIYSITHESGKTYIGQTVQKVSDRIKGHKNSKRKTSKITNAIKKYGIDMFTVDTIYKVYTNNKTELHNILNKLEKYYIDVYDTFNSGYNMTTGGDSNYIYSEEAKLSMRKKRTTKSALLGRCGKDANSYGSIRSDKTRERMSESKKGFKHPISIAVINKNTGKIYGSMREAENITKVDRSKIKKSCTGSKYIGWEYYEYIHKS